MSASQFSKGPWQIFRDRGGHTGMVEVAGPLPIVRGFMSALDVTYEQGQQTLADARLISAAPELYASAEETHAWVRRIQDVMTGYLIPDGYDADEALSKLIEMLDGPEQREIQGRAFAALRKAKGGVNGRP